MNDLTVASLPSQHGALSSPVGTLELEARGDQLKAIRFHDGDLDLPLAKTMGGVLESAGMQLEAWFQGVVRGFQLEFAMVGSDFELRVWREIARIPYATTATYGAIAAAVGEPGAARAVGRASGGNPLPIVIPCHRVVGSDGSLTGYGGGVERKRILLKLEQRWAGVQPGLPFGE